MQCIFKACAAPCAWSSGFSYLLIVMQGNNSMELVMCPCLRAVVWGPSKPLDDFAGMAPFRLPGVHSMVFCPAAGLLIVTLGASDEAERWASRNFMMPSHRISVCLTSTRAAWTASPCCAVLSCRLPAIAKLVHSSQGILLCHPLGCFSSVPNRSARPHCRLQQEAQPVLERAAKHGTARMAAIEMLGITAFVAADHSTCRELMEDLQALWGVTGGTQCWCWCWS